MKAVVYTEYGSPDVLHLQEVEKPAPKDNEILVRVRATPVSYGDLIARNFAHIGPGDFHMPGLLALPTRMAFGWNKPSKGILGSEFAGDVAAVGKDVKLFQPGDAIFGYLGQAMGAYAQYLRIAESAAVTQKPGNLSYEEAAAVPYGALMAVGLLRRVNVQPGQNVLINGASGGIGSAAVQLCKHFGAQVTGVCGTPRIPYVQALGADRVIDYTREDFTRNGKKYDLIFDVLGKTTYATCKNSLTPSGRCLYASFKSKQLGEMLWSNITGRRKVICALSTENQADLIFIKGLAEAGQYKAIIDRCFPLEQAAEAHRYVEAGQKKGSVVLVVA